MADLPDNAVGPGTWELDNFLDFSIGSPSNIFGWNSDVHGGNFGEELLLPGLDIEAQGLEERGSERGVRSPGGQGNEPLAGSIRKRDPRLTCENFLAGRVPCSCPEVDEMEEEEEYDGRMKRVKIAVVRCQVPSCEADISQLKGYHRRHRVCLGCANATKVELDGVPQRYCQQCGKFHLLPDFDEGKRSCRRKLERHNNRRRRKPVGDKSSVQSSRTESPPRNVDVEPFNDGKSGQESKSLSSLGTGEKQASSGSEELQISEVEQPYKDRLCLNNGELRFADAIHTFSSSRPVSVPTEVEGKLLPDKDIRHGENFNNVDRVVENPPASPSTIVGRTPDGDNSTYADLNQQSYTGFLMEESSHKDYFPRASGLNQRDEGSGPLRSSLSSSRHKNYSYTSVCPTGRISFKLYDWNPAEFPRRLRQQILQWLANMPIELEGYIRPGCTILTAFIALPQYMWDKLNGDSTSYICDLLNRHGSILSGRGNMLVYLNNIILQIKNGEASLVNTKMSQRVPRLYSVHPVFVEAGRPIEIIACGKNLFQSKFRFLISFGGSYLRYDSCETIPLHKIDSNFRRKENIIHPTSHESCKIVIPSTDSRLFGPAFVEVENESGISNFIPILIGDKQICSEFQLLEQQLMDCALCCTNDNEHTAIHCPNSDICKQNLMKRQNIFELLLDIGWVLKDPEPDENEIPVNNGHIQRLNHLLGFLIEGHFLSVLEKVLYSPKVIKMLNAIYEKYKKFNDADVELLQNYVKHARLSVRKKFEDRIDDSSQQFLEKVVMQEVPSKAETASKPRTDRLYECSGRREEIEETWADTDPSSGLQSMDVRILSVEENSMFMPLLEKECCSNISTELKQDSKLGVRKMIDVVRCAQTIKIELRRDSRVDRRIVILTIAVVAVCAGICVVLQHPHQVMEMSMSLRRCLFGLRKGQEASFEP